MAVIPTEIGHVYLIAWFIDINVRNIQTCRDFLWVYMNQTDNNCWEAISADWENGLENGSFAPYLIFYNQRRRCKGFTWNPLVTD